MFSVTLQSIAPVFFLIALGIFLYRQKVLDDTVNAGLSKLVYQVGLPALVFSKIAGSDLRTLWDIRESGFLIGSTILLFSLLWFLSKPWMADRRVWSAFVQAAYRSNTAIVGFAVVQNRYGDHGLAHAVMLLAFIIPLYNILAVILLTHASTQGRLRPAALGKAVIGNPLIQALLLALPFSLLRISLPPVVSVTLKNLSNMVLPLALIGIGADLRWHLSREFRAEITLASALKLLLFPALQMVGAWLLGIRGEPLGVLTLLVASPTAVSAYVMAKALGSDEKLTAQIIVASTAFCLLTMAGFVLAGQMTGWF